MATVSVQDKINQAALDQQYIITCKESSHQHVLSILSDKGRSHYHCNIDDKIYTYQIESKAIIGDGIVSVFPKT